MLFDFDAYYIEPIAEKDAWKLCDFSISNTERLRRYFPKTLEQNLTPDLSQIFVSKKVKQFLEKEEFLFKLKEKEGRTIIGLVYIKEIDWNKWQAELAYCISYQYEGKGWTTQAVSALSKYAFSTLGLTKLRIIAHKTNLGSVKVAEKCGYTWEGTLLKEHTPPGEDALDMELYELSKFNIHPSENPAGRADSNQVDSIDGVDDDARFNGRIKNKFYRYIQNLQDTITSALEHVDGTAKFREDHWERPEGGGGRTRVIENGTVFEKGGVNISAVHGELPVSMQHYFGVGDADFFACGLSLVLHPKNPMVPTVHANWRYFEMYDKKGNIVDQWFGGGQDLTPYYLFDEDAAHFHAVCKQACDTHDPGFYPTFKKKCDDYFWNTHRNEARGIGGLFFDYCKANDTMNMNDWYTFVTTVGDSFLEAYVPIVEKRKKSSYSSEQRDWQEIRRGRYVEFNLVHDKGTLFGLKTNGRIESILMSLPPYVQWRYDHQPKKGSDEERLVHRLKNPKNWT